jgi:DNA polymerase-3 subunit gamma/tau
MSFYHTYRPTRFKDFVGQDGSVLSLSKQVSKGSVPHVMLFTGPSGVGKTTLARIVAAKLGCESSDLKELNAADVRGVDAVRGIGAQIHTLPLHGKSRMWILDEVHQQTKDAQTALLKMLEDYPPHVYFALATTHPDKLLPAVKTRCTTIALRSLNLEELTAVVQRVMRKEKITLSEEVLELLCEVSEGSARKSLVLLEQIASLATDAERLSVLNASDTEKVAKQLLNLIVSPNPTWPDLVSAVEGVEDLESFRRGVLGYASAILLKQKKPTTRIAKRCALVLEVFRENWYDCGKAGLVSALYDIFGTN